MYVNGRCLCHRNMIFKGLDCSHLAAFFTSNVSCSKLLPTECCEGPILLIAFCSLWTNAACMQKTAFKLELWGAYPVTFYIFVLTDVIWKWASVLNFLWPSGGRWNTEADGGETARIQPSLKRGWCRRGSALVKVVSECEALLWYLWYRVFVFFFPLTACFVAASSEVGMCWLNKFPPPEEGDSSANSTHPLHGKLLRCGVVKPQVGAVVCGRKLHAPGPGEECMERGRCQTWAEGEKSIKGHCNSHHSMKSLMERTYTSTRANQKVSEASTCSYHSFLLSHSLKAFWWFFSHFRRVKRYWKIYLFFFLADMVMSKVY